MDPQQYSNFCDEPYSIRILVFAFEGIRLIFELLLMITKFKFLIKSRDHRKGCLIRTLLFV